MKLVDHHVCQEDLRSVYALVLFYIVQILQIHCRQWLETYNFMCFL